MDLAFRFADIFDCRVPFVTSSLSTAAAAEFGRAIREFVVRVSYKGQPADGGGNSLVTSRRIAEDSPGPSLLGAFSDRNDFFTGL